MLTWAEWREIRKANALNSAFGGWKEDVDVRLYSIWVSCRRNGRTNAEIAEHYHDKYGLDVVNVDGLDYKFGSGVLMRHSGPREAHDGN